MTRVAVVGLGAIGRVVVSRLVQGVPGVELTAVASRDIARAEATIRDLGADIPVRPLDQLEPLADLVVECAPAALLPVIVEPFLRSGKEAVVLSSGAILEHPELVDLAKEHGGQITIPSGALLGLDAVAAAAEGEIRSLRLTTRKPPAGLVGAPGLEESDVDLQGLTEPVLVFAGTARDAIRGFPANLNVAVALSLAGPGPDRTDVEVWADPTVTKNTHIIVMRSDVADVTMTIENVPSENPRTGRITPLSIISLLRKRHASLRVGS
ncbi:MAG TPA: aspartate dehydrogenase [Acidimicrobiia bacterium]